LRPFPGVDGWISVDTLASIPGRGRISSVTVADVAIIMGDMKGVVFSGNVMFACKEMVVFGAEVIGDIGDAVFTVESLLES